MDTERPWLRMGIVGATCSAAGIIFSGPVAVALVQWLHPQPEWAGALAWAANQHPVQMLPYLFGLPLVAGYLMQAIAIYGVAPPEEKPRTMLGLVLTAMFGTLILFNYLTQTTFMPALAQHYRPRLDSAVETFSLSNPVSLAWAIEMWAWGVLGIAGALWVRSLRGSNLEAITGDLLLANGAVSVAGVVVTVISPGWEFTAAGTAAYVGWNLLVLVTALMLLWVLVRRSQAPHVETPTLSLTGKLELKLPGMQG